MVLKKVTIHKYKSFLTEQTYDVENQITRIVGKNESGKTALLEALAKSNYFENNSEFKFNKDLDSRFDIGLIYKPVKRVVPVCRTSHYFGDVALHPQFRMQSVIHR